MDLLKSDRDKLRASRHKLDSSFPRLNIIEHKVMDPKKYKQLSNEDSQSKSIDSSTKVHYESKFFGVENGTNHLESIPEIKTADRVDDSVPKVLEELQAHAWLNMERAEFDKLEWMSDKAERAYQEKLRSSTHFDFEGRTVPMSSEEKQGTANSFPEKTTNGGQKLEQSHDLDTLINMLDSDYKPQITYALGVISRIANLATLGHYDGTFNDNIHSILLRRALLRVRRCLDSPNETNRQNALKCLRALLCNTQVDEVILDRIYPIISEDIDLNLRLDTGIGEFSIDMKDNECVEKDAILALVLRTDIIRRLHYLLTTKEDNTYHECILDIFIRIARHSTKVCLLLNEKPLLENIVNLFLPAHITSATKQIRALSVKALKLIRVIAHALAEAEDKLSRQVQSQDRKADCQIPGKIVRVLEAYFHIDCFDARTPDSQEVETEQRDQDYLLRLHIESLRAIKTLFRLYKFQRDITSIVPLGYQKLVDSFTALASLSPVKALNSRILFDWQYAAHLLDLSGSSAKTENNITIHFVPKEGYPLWLNSIRPILFRWLEELICDNWIPHLDVSIAIATGVYHYSNRGEDFGSQLLHNVMIQPICESYRDVGHSNLLKSLARSAYDKSQLPGLLEQNGRRRDAKELPSYGCLIFNTEPEYQFKFNQLFQPNSPYILLNTFLGELQANLSKSSKLKAFVDNHEILRYIRLVNGYHTLPMNYEELAKDSLLAQYEVQIISQTLLLLSQYYLYMGYNIETGTDELNNMHFASKGARNEKYCNLCYHVISSIGLLDTKSEFGFSLKERLLKNILLEPRMQYRVCVENFLAGSGHIDHIAGEQIDKQVPQDHLSILTPLYLSTRHSDRFWILQPLIDYYHGQSKSTELNQNQRSDWFKLNVPWRTEANSLTSCDERIISVVLSFNSSMIHQSPPYKKLVVKPNIEEYICIVGSIFLQDDIFLDEDVSRSIADNLRMMADCFAKAENGKLDPPFKDKTKTINSLNLTLGDFFIKLIDQFESVSYGDETFARFILMFISPKSDKTFRKILFQEKSESCLRQIRIGIEDSWLPIEMYTASRESDPELRQLIKRSRQHLQPGTFLDFYTSFHSEA